MSRLLDHPLGTTGERVSSAGDTRPESTPEGYDDPATDVIPELPDSQALSDLSHPHLADPVGVGPETVHEQARAYRERGASAATFVAAHGVAVDAAVESAFDELRAELDDEATIDRVERRLTDTLGAVVDSAATGTAAFDRRVAADGGAAADTESSLAVETVDDAADDIDEIAAANEKQMERASRITGHFE